MDIPDPDLYRFAELRRPFEIKGNQGDQKFTLYPLMLAAAKNNVEAVRGLILNTTVDINCHDDHTGVNSFWIASYYGSGDAMKILAESGVDIYNTNEEGLNALHIAVI